MKRNIIWETFVFSIYIPLVFLVDAGSIIGFMNGIGPIFSLIAVGSLGYASCIPIIDRFSSLKWLKIVNRILLYALPIILIMPWGSLRYLYVVTPTAFVLMSSVYSFSRPISAPIPHSERTVKHDLIERINTGKLYSNVMLGIIFVIVGFGVFFSVGTVSLDEYRAIKELENDKVSIMRSWKSIEENSAGVRNVIRSLSTTPTTDAHINFVKESVDQFNANVVNNGQVLISKIDTLGSANLLDRLNKIQENRIRWDGIIMRVSLALITVFLVQIFFNVYKYYQVQINVLQNKLEAIKLYEKTEDVDENKYLRKTVIDNVNTTSNFGKPPASPIDQILKTAEMMKDKAKPGGQ